MSPIELRVREYRERAGLTGAELAKRARVRPNTISDIENGTTKGIRWDVLDRIAVALGVDAALLIVHTRKGRR